MNGLTRDERISVLRELSGHLQADRHPGAQWLGECLGRWLRHGGDLPKLLGVKARRGSRRTVQAVLRQDEIDTLMMRLVGHAGSVRAASEMLRGIRPCPPHGATIVQALRASKAPTSPESIRRARRRARHSR